MKTFDRVSSVVVRRFPLESDRAAVELVNGNVLGFTGSICRHHHSTSSVIQTHTHHPVINGRALSKSQ